MKLVREALERDAMTYAAVYILKTGIVTDLKLEF